MLPAVAYGIVGWPLSPANLLGTALAVLILLEGTAYWLLKLRNPGRPAGMGVFAVLRWLNPVLLAVALPVLVVALAHRAGRRGPARARVLGARGRASTSTTSTPSSTGGRRPAHLGRDIARRR